MTKEENLRFKENIIKKQFKKSLGYELNLENTQQNIINYNLCCNIKLQHRFFVFL